MTSSNNEVRLLNVNDEGNPNNPHGNNQIHNNEENNPLILEQSRIYDIERHNSNDQLQNQNVILNRNNLHAGFYLKSRQIKEFLRDFLPSFLNVRKF